MPRRILSLLLVGGASEGFVDGDGELVPSFKGKAHSSSHALLTRTSAPNHSGLAPWQIRATKAYIAANLDQKLLQKHLATRVRLSVSHFSAAFKESFGDTPHAYLIRCRIELAQQMMLKTDEPLTQISLACGLGEQAHFCRTFRKKTGLSPGAWRRNNKLEHGSSVPIEQTVDHGEFGRVRSPTFRNLSPI